MDGKGATDKQLTDLLEESRKLKEDLRLDKAKLVDARCEFSTYRMSSSVAARTILDAWHRYSQMKLMSPCSLYS